MKRLRSIRILVFLAGLAVTACNGVYSPYTTYGGGTGKTMSGTLTLTGLSATGYAYVTATMASYPYTTTVLEPAISATQTLSYSVANLPSGTYSVTVTITTTKPTPTSGSCTYTVNAGTPVADLPSASGAGPYTWTMTIGSLPVSANTQLDVAMQ